MTNKAIIIPAMLLTSSCVEPFELPFNDGASSLLVVDGLLDGEGVAQVQITRSIALDNENAIPPEESASVWVERMDGTSWTLNETAPGVYRASGISIGIGDEYRVRINTRSGDKAFSEWVPMKQTPAIQSLTWQATQDGLEVYAATSDPSESSIFYKWDYSETWEYTAAFFSETKFNFGSIVQRRPEEYIHRCYRTEHSTDILLSSTLRLEEDIVTRQQLTFLPKGTQRLTHQYSISARLRSLTREEYDYWTNLSRTTEQVGGLFDAQPSEVVGNFRTENGAVALGIFSATQVSVRRLNITFDELPVNLMVPQSFPNCEMLEIIDFTWFPLNISLIARSRLGYHYSSIECVDCRIQGGTTTKPDFWD